jgi:4-hydroxybenzoyl-CoA thioesterase
LADRRRTTDETTDSRYIAVEVRVRWGDCDPAGIAFYPRFFEWMDLASHALARELGVSADDMLPPKLLGFPLVTAQAEFLVPARLEDALEVRAWITRVGRTSFGMRHEIVRLGDPLTLLARGREERVHIGQDETGTMRPRELTPQMREILAVYADPAAAGGKLD